MDASQRKKRQKFNRLDALTDDAPLPPTIPEPLDSGAYVDVNEMVANMKKQIEERKRHLS